MRSFDWERFADWFTPHRVTATNGRRAEFQHLMKTFHALRRRLTALNAVDARTARAMWLRYTPERLGVPVFLLPQAQEDERRFLNWVLGRPREMDRDLAMYRAMRSSMAVEFDEGSREAVLARPADAASDTPRTMRVSDLITLLEAKELPPSPTPGHAGAEQRLH